MPYVIRQDNNQYCVYTADANGAPSGEAHGCHETEEQATAQVRALYANAEDAKAEAEGKPTNYPCVGPDCPDGASNTGSPVVSNSPYPAKASTYLGGGFLKAIGTDGAGLIGGYLATFGGPKDTQGEWFDPDCEFHLDWYGGNTPVLFHHGLKDRDLIEDIGRVVVLKRDSNGLYAEAQLDLSNPYAQQVYREVKAGRIGWSSGSSPHLSKVERDGRIKEWAIVEASLTPTPAAGRRTTVQALKFDTSVFPPDSAAETSAAIDPVQTGKEPTANAAGRVLSTNSKTKRGMNMNVKMDMLGALEKAGLSPEQIVATLKELAAQDAAEMPADTVQSDVTTDPAPAPVAPDQPMAKAADAPITAKQAAVMFQTMMQTMKTAPAPSAAAGFQGENPTIKTQQPRISNMRTPYHDLNAEDMAFLWEARRNSKKTWEVTPEFVREMTTKAIKAIDAGQIKLDDKEYRQVAMKADMAAKVEFNNTLVAADGGNWVPTLWSSALWPRVRVDNKVAANIETFELPSPSYEYPIESSDPTVNAVGQADTDAESTLATNVFTRSKLTADKITFNAKKLGLQVGFSTEIEEDSIIPFIPQLRAQAVRAFANAIDNVILNADDATGTGNINYKGANTSAAPTSKWLYGGGNGMRYNAIITNAAVANLFKNLQGGAPTLTALRAARFGMISALNAYGIDPSLLMYIVDPYTYGKMLSIDEVLTYMNNGRGSTVNDGLIPAIDGSPIFPSAELALTDSTGYALANGTGTLGQCVIVAKPDWKLGYVRQVTTDVSYIPWNDEYVLTMTARCALGKKTTTGCALLYNIGLS